MNLVLIHRDGKQFGPYTLAEVKAHVASGNIISTDLYWSDGMTAWQAISEFDHAIHVPAQSEMVARSTIASEKRSNNKYLWMATVVIVSVGGWFAINTLGTKSIIGSWECDADTEMTFYKDGSLITSFNVRKAGLVTLLRGSYQINQDKLKTQMHTLSIHATNEQSKRLFADQLGDRPSNSWAIYVYSLKNDMLEMTATDGQVRGERLASIGRAINCKKRD